MKYATSITINTADTIEATVWLAGYESAAADPLAIRLRWTWQSGFGTAAELDGTIAGYATRGYKAAARNAINKVRDAAA